MPPWVEVSDPALMTATTFNLHNLRGQSLLFRCLETGFVTTAPALTRYQQGRGIDPSRRELVGERPAQWCRTRPVTICEHCGVAIKGNQWTVRQHQQSQRCRRARTQLPAQWSISPDPGIQTRGLQHWSTRTGENPADSR
jgi:hypothetical protein